MLSIADRVGRLRCRSSARWRSASRPASSTISSRSTNLSSRTRKLDGSMSEDQRRLVFERGDSAAVLLFNTDTKCVVLVNQFKAPTLGKGQGGGWITETLAGMVDRYETPEATAVRETLEETGYDISETKLKLITKFFSSPGGTSECIYLYYAQVRDADKVAEGGGNKTEGEDITVKEIPLDELLEIDQVQPHRGSEAHDRRDVARRRVERPTRTDAQSLPHQICPDRPAGPVHRLHHRPDQRHQRGPCLGQFGKRRYDHGPVYRPQHIGEYPLSRRRPGPVGQPDRRHHQQRTDGRDRPARPGADRHGNPDFTRQSGPNAQRKGNLPCRDREGRRSGSRRQSRHRRSSPLHAKRTDDGRRHKQAPPVGQAVQMDQGDFRFAELRTPYFFR